VLVAAEPTDDLTILRREEEVTAPKLNRVFSGWHDGIVALESGDLDKAEIHLRDVLTAPKAERCAAADVLALCALARINLARICIWGHVCRVSR
jgi:hypothetical protein